MCFMYFCVVLCVVCFVTFPVLFVVYMCTEQLPPGGYPIAVKYIIFIIRRQLLYMQRMVFTTHLRRLAANTMKVELCRHFSSPHTCCIPHPSHYNWLFTRIIFSGKCLSGTSTSCGHIHSPVTFLHLKSKYLSRHPIPEHPQLVFHLHRAKLSFTFIQNRQTYSSVYLDLYILW
jgi:hypothetical protein